MTSAELAGLHPAKKKDHFPETGFAVNFQKVRTLDVSGSFRSQSIENGDTLFFPSRSLLAAAARRLHH